MKIEVSENMNHFARIQKSAIAILCVVCTLFCFSCTSKSEGGLNDGPLLSENQITVKVENALKYSNVVEVKLMGFDRSSDRNVELARGEWIDGGFAIELPKTLSSNYLYALINNNGLPATIIIYTPSTFAITNKNIKLTNVEFWGVDKDGNVVTHFYPFKIDEGGNAESAFLTYVDSDVTISGYNVGGVAFTEFDEERNADIWYSWQKTTTYSINWKKGWNIWCRSNFKYDSTERTIKEEWSTIPASGLKWYGGEDLWKLNRN